MHITTNGSTEPATELSKISSAGDKSTTVPDTKMDTSTLRVLSETKSLSNSIKHSLHNLSMISEQVYATGIKDSKMWTQFFAAFACAMCQWGIGSMMGYPGVVLPLLTDTESDDIVLTKAQASLFTGIIHVGGLIGSILAGVTMTYFGQRMTLLYSLPLSILSWTLIGLSSSFPVLIVARIIAGVTCGMFSSTSYNYVVELAHTSVRGRLVAMSDLFRQAGFTVTMIFGCFDLTWREQAFLQIPFLILAFAILCLMQDSPRWLAMRIRKEDAHKSLTFYRGSKYDVNKELDDIWNQVNDNTSKLNIRGQMKLMISKEVLPIVLITSFIMAFIHFGGNVVTVSYSVVIFKSTKVDVDPYMSSIVAGGMRILGALTYILIADRFSRKLIFTIPLTIAGVSITFFGSFFYFQKTIDVSFIYWIPVVSMASYSYFTSVYYPAMMLVRGELLPNAVRSLGSSFHFVVLSSMVFLVASSYPYMVESLGFLWTFWCYGIASFIMSLFITIFVPETQGKTLEAIEDMQMQKHKQKQEIQNK